MINAKLPDHLRKVGFAHELQKCAARIDGSLIKRGVVDITEKLISDGRVTSASGQLKPGRYIAKLRDDGQGSQVVEGKVELVKVDLEPSRLQPNESPEVSTIDRYQGAENEIVIVSLVRSNEKKKLGFLGTDDGRNRMCVAQSRAKCGLYFIGNVECLSTAAHWKQLLGLLQERGCVGDKFPQRCPRHPDVHNHALEAEDLGILVQHVQPLVVISFTWCALAWSSRFWLVCCFIAQGIVCKHKCGKAFGCGQVGHVCQRACHPDTGHEAKKCVAGWQDGSFQVVQDLTGRGLFKGVSRRFLLQTSQGGNRLFLHQDHIVEKKYQCREQPQHASWMELWQRPHET